MNIELPPDLESFVRSEVTRGRFASTSEAVAGMVRAFIERDRPSPTRITPAPESTRPVWERILDRAAAIPEGEWDAVPTDLAERHDEHLRGLVDRPQP